MTHTIDHVAIENSARQLRAEATRDSLLSFKSWVVSLVSRNGAAHA